jgi:hypothetical protein
MIRLGLITILSKQIQHLVSIEGYLMVRDLIFQLGPQYASNRVKLKQLHLLKLVERNVLLEEIILLMELLMLQNSMKLLINLQFKVSSMIH